MPRIEVAGDICLRRPRTTQGCRADDDDDDDDDRESVYITSVTALSWADRLSGHVWRINGFNAKVLSGLRGEFARS
jgi:hypothetical protein